MSLNGKPLANAPVKVDLFQKKTYSHRKRLVGGFYAYEHFSETKRLGPACEGRTDKRGLLLCEKPTTVSGELIVQATTNDDAGRAAIANLSTWVAGEDDWWFAASDDDRIDLLPEKKRYEPGDNAQGSRCACLSGRQRLSSPSSAKVSEMLFVKEISGKQPVIELPIKGNYAPNAFVSVMVVRGRVSGVQPTATVDLGRPAYKLGIAEINVGWKAHELKVKVSADRPQYKVREKAKVQITVTTPEGTPPPKGSEVALAAVDEGIARADAERQLETARLDDGQADLQRGDVHGSNARHRQKTFRHESSAPGRRRRQSVDARDVRHVAALERPRAPE